MPSEGPWSFDVVLPNAVGLPAFRVVSSRRAGLLPSMTVCLPGSHPPPPGERTLDIRPSDSHPRSRSGPSLGVRHMTAQESVEASRCCPAVEWDRVQREWRDDVAEALFEFADRRPARFFVGRAVEFGAYGVLPWPISWVWWRYMDAAMWSARHLLRRSGKSGYFLDCAT